MRHRWLPRPARTAAGCALALLAAACGSSGGHRNPSGSGTTGTSDSTGPSAGGGAGIYAAAVGPGYARDILAPMPFLRVVPSGGVSLENAGEWIRAGAAAVSVGGALLSAALLRSESGAELTRGARALVERVAEARRVVGGDPA